MQIQIDSNILNHVASKILSKTITHTTHTSRQLQGGTVGDVQLLSGTAHTADGEALPFHVVLKTQKKWERWRDPNSWRREYDFYKLDLSEAFSSAFRRPECYDAEFSEEGTRLWMEYIQGVSGDDLTVPMMEKAAYELGLFQGRLHAQPSCLAGAANMRDVNARETHFRHWKPKNLEYSYIRSADCPIPKHLRDMIIDIDSRADDIFQRIRKLPVVLYHGDYWTENIIYANDTIAALDWDTAGWGYLGEDIVSLITDETNPALWAEYKAKLIPAYFKGISAYMDIDSSAMEAAISDMILTDSYNNVCYYMRSLAENDEESFEDAEYHLNELEMRYEVFYKAAH